MLIAFHFPSSSATVGTLRFEKCGHRMDQLDVGAWVGIIALILAFPVAVMGHLFGHRLLLNLERRKLVKGDATRQQAIQAYNRVKSFHNRTRDRYPYYLLLAGSAVICAVASSTSIILIVIIYPAIPMIPFTPLTLLLFLLAFGGALLAVLFMVGLYQTSRHLDRFDDYKAELEQQWGPIDENP
jgi:hypothetical protein